ncbi:glycerol-3-phosphate acyltransferase PlsY [Thermosulfidibacter takaii ABI70S6]|uniref:Glycerol-3-phosphate acyltransferase n=1 Tax=Thermosulfidibacter takaii (strain DSM 17441 / JCM 13301 / NBRC 103674 / ABI70S6) TaxID=1298851 RepID=A0A0S3QRD3_THET7|nr:glycerol-3-phosphate 1-O-acyltransferase PlsY [Thermosulfidibacter takaii]BAT70861.1 glycerol-3-phosphate acyltransferase PlsY [Thermosulfidibacter takaii ABI70S6]
MSKIVFLIISFLCGSIPFGILVAKLFNAPDPRTVGSGNIGATNVARAAGAKAGVLTLTLDIGKGAVPVMIARHLFPDPTFLVWCGFAAILGHCYSPFLRFNGGKGVATGAGIFLAINPKAFALAFLVFLIAFALTRIVSLSSILSAISMPLWVYIFTKETQIALITLLISAFIVFRHKDNIRRLLKGEEKRFKPKEG